MLAALATIVDDAGNPLVAQSIAGCSDASIGAGGLTQPLLAKYLEQLRGPVSELRLAYHERKLPHLLMPEATDDIANAEAAMAALADGARTIVFLGTGGSSLGGQALSQLSGWNLPGGADLAQRQRPRARFYDNLDALTLGRALASLDLETTRFVVISKSGGTPETLVQAVAALSAMQQAGLSTRIPASFLALTDPTPPERNGLRRLAADQRFPVLDHEPGIGGRFSVLTNVGLLPAIARGLDVRALRRGAAATVKQLVDADDPSEIVPAVGAATAIALAKEREISASVMMPYADRLGRFASWYVQLWAESLGKAGNGTIPLACLGPLDQHSQLQLFMDGPKRLLMNVVDVRNREPGPTLDPDLCTKAGIGFLGGRAVGDLVAAQSLAVPRALGKAGRPVRRITLERLDESCFGALLMSMMLETILAGRLLGVDPFDQPAVELAKVLAREHLSGASGN